MTNINERLIEAVDQDDIGLVKDLLNEGADVNFDDRFVFKNSIFQEALTKDSKDLAYVILKHKPRITEVEKQFVEKLCESEWSDISQEVKSLLEDCELIPQFSGPITMLGNLLDDISPAQAENNLCEALKSVENDNKKFDIASYLSKQEVEELAKIDLSKIAPYISSGDYSFKRTSVELEEFSEKDSKIIDGILSRVEQDMFKCIGSDEVKIISSLQIFYPNDSSIPDVRWHSDEGGYGNIRTTLSLNDVGTLFVKEAIKPTNFLTENTEVFQADYGGMSVFKIGGAVHSSPIISAPRLLAVFGVQPDYDYLNKLWKESLTPEDSSIYFSDKAIQESDGLVGQPGAVDFLEG